MTPPDAVTFFMYHDVRDPDSTAFPRRYSGTSFLTPSQFDGQLDYVTTHYRVVALHDVVLAAQGGRALPPRPAVLTFDDGALDHFTQVFPRLVRRGLVGTFLVPTRPVAHHEVMASHKIQFILAAVENERQIVDEIFVELDRARSSRHDAIPSNESLWREYSVSRWAANTWTAEMVFVTRLLRTALTSELRTLLIDTLFASHVTSDEAGFAQSLYMSTEQVACLAKSGMEVGGHGYRSVDLRLLGQDDKRAEILQNRDFLRARVFGGESFPFFYSYPNGGVDDASVEILREAGCAAALTTRAEVATDLGDLLRLPRFNAPNVFPHDASALPVAPTQAAYALGARSAPSRSIPAERAGWRIALCGVQQQGLDIADHLLSHGVPISHLVTIPLSLAEKNKAAGWVSYESFGAERALPIHFAASYGLSSASDLEFFRHQAFDLLLLGGWQRLIPDEILRTLRIGGVGQHGSSEYLPRGRGRSPLNWSLIQDRQRLVWNLFMLTPAVDSGAIVDTQVFEINDWDDCRTLYYKVAVSVKHMLARTVPRLMAGGADPRPQVGEPTFYAQRAPEDGLIDWRRMSVREIYNLVRAVTRPYPGAFTRDAHGRVVHIWRAQRWDAALPFYASADYGEVVERFAGGDFVVHCVDGLLLVTDADDPGVRVGTVYG
jgi:methionyl-tRNA formyltransferase/peptidoglycan/xylan/chitin deacetylase (PgdA/CDA1 family)